MKTVEKKDVVYVINASGKRCLVNLPDNYATCFVGIGLVNHLQDNDEISPIWVYPIFDGHAYNNLYGRLMTIIEATTENEVRQKALKNIVSKELNSFNQELQNAVSELANYQNIHADNIYNK